MNQNIKDDLCNLLKAQNTFPNVKQYLEKISQNEQKYYEPICYAILNSLQGQDPIQCLQAATMAKEAIEKQNNDFITVFQDICLKQYEQLAEQTLNGQLIEKAAQYFQRPESASSHGTKFFQLTQASIVNWATQYPRKNDGKTPTKFYQLYENLVQKGMIFFQAQNLNNQQIYSNNTNVLKDLDLVRDLQQQLQMQKQQSDLELSIKEQTHKRDHYNWKQKIKHYEDQNKILNEQIQIYKNNEDKILQEFEKTQKRLKQLELELKNSKQQEGINLNDQQDKKNLTLKIQLLIQQNEDLQKNCQSLTQQLQQQVNERQFKNDQNQLQQLELSNINLKKELEEKKSEIQDHQIQCLEKEQIITQLKLQLKAKEKLISKDNEKHNQEEKIQKLEKIILDNQKMFKHQEEQSSSYQQKYEEQLKINQRLEAQIINLQQQLKASENKIQEQKAQQDYQEQISPIKNNSAYVQMKKQSNTQYQNFFPLPGTQQNLQQQIYFNPTFDFKDDLQILFTKPLPIEVEKISSTQFYPLKSPEQYYPKTNLKQNKGQEISYQNFISIIKDLKQKNKELLQIFHVKRTNNYFIEKNTNQIVIQIAILQKIVKQREQYQANFGVYFKSDEQSINIQGRFLNLNRMLNYFSSSQTDFNVTLKKKQQYLLEYSMNDKCNEILEIPILEIKYKDKSQQLVLPIPLFSYIDFSPNMNQETFKKLWKQCYIYRSRKFNYNPCVLPQHDSILNISQNLILLNQDKLKSYLQGIDEIKYGAYFKFLSTSLDGLIKFELIPQNQIIIYIGVKKEKSQQFQSLIARIIFVYHQIFE